MKNTKRCLKCSSQNIVRIPDNQNRHAAETIFILRPLH